MIRLPINMQGNLIAVKTLDRQFVPFMYSLQRVFKMMLLRWHSQSIEIEAVLGDRPIGHRAQTVNVKTGLSSVTKKL